MFAFPMDRNHHETTQILIRIIQTSEFEQKNGDVWAFFGERWSSPPKKKKTNMTMEGNKNFLKCISYLKKIVFFPVVMLVFFGGV